MRKVTIKDIAKIAGVSYATVSRALSDSPEIGEDTRQRILDISREVGYTPNTVARSLVARKTGMFGLIVGSISNPFMSEIAFHVERKARERGYNLMLCNSDSNLDQEEETYRLLMGRQVDGIIIIPSGIHSYDRLSRYLGSMPTVFVSENLRDIRESYVAVDNYKGTYMGTEYLYSMGHRSIIYFSRRSGSLTHSLRAEGYADACKACGIAPRFVDSRFSSSSIQNGYTLACELFREQRRDYTAIFAVSDATALGVMQAAEEYDIRIPEDVSLLGFDNIAYASLPKINLSTIEQPKEAMAAAAVDMLNSKINDPVSGYSHRVMEPSLITRGSCRRISPGGAVRP